MTSPDETERTTDSPLTGGRPPATREELAAGVEERTPAGAAAEDGPILNPTPPRKRAAAQKAPAARPAAQGASRKPVTSRPATGKAAGKPLARGG